MRSPFGCSSERSDAALCIVQARAGIDRWKAPFVTGCDACRRIRSQPSGQDIVIVALTGWGQEEDRRRSVGPQARQQLLDAV